MVATLVRVTLADGSEILSEAEEPAGIGVTPVGMGADGKIQFSIALDQIKSAACELQQALLSMVAPPESCEVTFGIKLSAVAGVILAKAGSEANFQVKMSWKTKA